VKSTTAEEIGRDQRDLNAYHDGELSGLRRWMFERRMARSPGLRAELEALKRLSRSVQTLGLQPPNVDVWGEVSLRLPAIDSELDGQRQGRDAQQRGDVEPRAWFGTDWLAAYSRPVTAVAAAVALALALFLGIMEDSAPATRGMIRWMDTGGRSVMVLEDQDDATIVWLLDAPEDGTSKGGSREAV
jgi:anti-sigma factor RsiW